MVSEVGRPDDGTDTGGFGNTGYFVDLKPHDQWRPVFHKNKEELIAAMNLAVQKYPGAIWNFSQPIEDNVGETMTGTKGALALKIFGDDLKLLEQKGEEAVAVMESIPGLHDVKLLRDFGQPNLDLTIDRRQAARFGINVTDIQDAVQTAVGGNAVSQVLIGEQRYDVVARYQAALSQYRAGHREGSPAFPFRRAGIAGAVNQCRGQGRCVRHLPGRQNSRYVRDDLQRERPGSGNHGRRRDQSRSIEKVKMPPGYHVDLSGEYESEKRAEARLRIIVPLTLLVIFIILYTMFRSFKWAAAHSVQRRLRALRRPAGSDAYRNLSSACPRASACWRCSAFRCKPASSWSNTSTSSGPRGHSIVDAAVEGAVLRLRPIMMTMLVATLGLLPAALSHEIGSDSQRPFAIVIVGGLLSALTLSIVLLPTFYVWIARDGDVATETGGGH